MQHHPDYTQWKEVMDDMFGGRISKGDAVEKWKGLLSSSIGFKLRPNHTQEAYSYFVYDKERYSAEADKPLGLGIVYSKPNNIKTQDIIIVHPLSGVRVYYKEHELVKDYPSMIGVHKQELPI